MSTSSSSKGPHWWKESVVYQIYPASFKDSNGDGLGDLPGIVSKVDYLASLGVDAIWISPFFKSPQVDMGYDISDYREVHEPYGTVKDVDELIAQLRKHDMKLLMDLVVNHTSNEHPWFVESKSSTSNPKRDWYIWRKGTVGPNGEKSPPNNWESLFKGSTWEYDENTDEYYFHLFHAGQPDLNWENPDVRAQVYDDMHFWLRKGLGGLRFDAVNLLSKPQDFRDAPVTQHGPYQNCFGMIKNRDRCHAWLQEMKREVLDRYPDLMTVGECGGTNDVAEVMKYIDPERQEFDMIFQFELSDIDMGPLGVFSRRDWDLSDIKRVTERWQNCLRPAWNTVHMENHDSGRSNNRYGRTSDPSLLPAVSKMLSFYMMTLGGTLFLHQGQEIGAQSLTADVGLEEYKDMATHRDFNQHKTWRVQHAGPNGDNNNIDMSDVMREIQLKARDHSRVPMAWNGSATDNAGFTDPSATPWMTLGTTYHEINVSDQERQPDSVLNTWREMIRFRRENVAELVYGSFEPVDIPHEQIFAYTRTSSVELTDAIAVGERDDDKAIQKKTKKTLLVALNWCDQHVTWQIPASFFPSFSSSETPNDQEKKKLVKKVGTVKETTQAEGQAGQIEFEPYACACWEIL